MFDLSRFQKKNHAYLEQRDNSIDAVKAFAIIGVICIHVSSGGYNTTFASWPWYCTLFYGCVARASVPLFFMCSGALLLDPRRSFSSKKFFSKNFVRIIVAMLVWAITYKAYHIFVGQQYSWQIVLQSLKEVLLFQQEFHLYYLHIILLVYLFLPIIRVFTQNASKKQFAYLLSLWFVFGILYPTVISFWPFSLLSGIPLQYKINMAYASIGYCVLGYFLTNYRNVRRFIFPLLWSIGFLLIFVGTSIISVTQGSLNTSFLEGMSLGVAIMTAGIWGTIRMIELPYWLKLLSYKISNASFGIYLSHMFYVYFFNHFGFSTAVLPIISIPTETLLVFICSYITYCILDRIPIVNKYLI